MKRDFGPLSFRGAYVRGRFVPPTEGDRFVSEDPGDAARPGGEARGSTLLVADAVAAARSAAPAWREESLAQRIAILRRYQKKLAGHGDRLAWVMSRETGKPLQESRDEVAAMVAKVDLTVTRGLPLVADRRAPLDGGSRSVLRYRPRGVVGVIGPFNVPGHLPNGQIVPALLTGNTVVFKPSEFTPFVGQVLAELFDEAGFPPGVFNLVQGGGEVGAALAAEPGVNALFFTGSAATGEKVRALSDRCPDRLLALDLGGKNAALILPDAPWEAALGQVVHGAFATAGQRCSSTSRLFVHKKIARRFIRDLMARAAALTVGYFTESPGLGPLIDGRAVQRFEAAQESAEKRGFATLKRGVPAPQSRSGHYVAPSVHLWEGFPSRLLIGPRDYWDEELFAPDLAVYVLDGEDEMIALNNASRYGLVASVFTASRPAFERIRERLDNGVVHWNRSTAMTPGVLPFGGTKARGNGWPAGLFVPFACTVPVGSVETPARRS